jgi:glutamyl-tRNA synthetase
MDELIRAFSLERVGKSGSKFDPVKAKWYNHYYLNRKSNEELTALYQPILRSNGITRTDEYVGRIIRLIKERANFVNDFWDQSWFFFQAPASYDPSMIAKRWKDNTPGILIMMISEFEKLNDFTGENLEKTINNFLEVNHLVTAQVMPSIRLALVGSGTGPGVAEIMALLGKEEVIYRIKKAIETIKI